MKKNLLLWSTIGALAVYALPMRAFETVVNSKSVGAVSIKSQQQDAWQVKAHLEEQGGKEYIHIRLSAPTPMAPPKFEVSFLLPQQDAHHLWNASANVDRAHLRADWDGHYRSSLAQEMPLYAFINENSGNRLTVASNESFRQLNATFGLREEGCVLVGRFDYFTQPEAPISSYETSILLDSRSVFWAESIREGAEWMSQSAGLQPCAVPADAWEPLYSSWYQFHQNVFDHEIEAECQLASRMGMKTIIVDDGWQTDDTSRGYAYCGDWQVSKRRFPNMAEHVNKVHQMGMNYMMWYSVPFMGYKSQNYERFKGKYLRDDDGMNASVLDPRFPEVREYLIGVYEQALKEWNLDGFKLDFIDSFSFGSNGDPALKDNYAGRDIQSLPQAIDVLMKGIQSRLNAIKPDILLEFRQAYIGPAIRQYGNMFRAADCPGDLQANRFRTINLRLTSGGTAVHSDMLEWNNAESPEAAARTILASLFSVVQYSLMLRDIPEQHTQVIRHWIDFTQQHRNTLLHGSLKPYHPEACYPCVEAESTGERIIAVYQDDVVAKAGPGNKPVYFINASMADSMVIDVPSAPKRVQVVDVYGNVKSTAPAVHPGLNRIPVPLSGYIKLEY